MTISSVAFGQNTLLVSHVTLMIPAAPIQGGLAGSETVSPAPMTHRGFAGVSRFSSGAPHPMLGGQPARKPKTGARRKATDSLRHVRSLVAERLNIDRKVLGAFEGSDLRQLLVMVGRGGQTARLTLRILRVVHETSPGREKEALRKLAEYPGSFSILEKFLFYMGTGDPFTAAARAQITVLPISQLPPEAEITEVEKGGVTQRVTRGASGHQITGWVYCVYDPDSPATTVGFVSKQQAIFRPFHAFQPGRFEKTVVEKRNEGRRGRIREILGGLHLDDLLEHPELAAASKSPRIQAELAIYEELRQAIRQYREQLEYLTLSGSSLGGGIRPMIEALNVRTDPGGQLFGWFERWIKEGHEVPEGLQAALEALRNPYIDLSPEQERMFVAGLTAYMRLHTYIRKEAVLSGLQDDLLKLDSLRADDPIRRDTQWWDELNRARTHIYNLRKETADEITLADFSKLLNFASLVAFRREMNRRCLEKFGEEFVQALATLAFVTRDSKGNWQEDVFKGIPKKRLRKTEAGRKGLLLHADFKAVIDADFHWAITRKDGERFLAVMPIPHFHRMVNGLIVAHRKLKSGVFGTGLMPAECFRGRVPLAEVARLIRSGDPDEYRLYGWVYGGTKPNWKRILREADAGLYSLEYETVLRRKADGL